MLVDFILRLYGLLAIPTDQIDEKEREQEHMTASEMTSFDSGALTKVVMTTCTAVVLALTETMTISSAERCT